MHINGDQRGTSGVVRAKWAGGFLKDAKEWSNLLGLSHGVSGAEDVGRAEVVALIDATAA